MTCFWDAIIHSLKDDDLRLLNLKKRPTHRSFIEKLKQKNTAPRDVLWNNQTLTQVELNEHIEAVKCYNIGGIHGGHLTSTCDSFLLLLCQLLKINIKHRYISTNIHYKYKRGGRKTLHFHSSRSHFSLN